MNHASEEVRLLRSQFVRDWNFETMSSVTFHLSRINVIDPAR